MNQTLRFTSRCDSLARVKLPYKVATLLYCFNERDEVLLLERAQEPNRGFWSPCGGKVHIEEGESPYACACREADEEIGLKISASDLHLIGVVSEHAYAGQGHWLMFLFEVKPRLKDCPPAHREGVFCFFPRERIASLNIPQTDREIIWPLIWHHRGGFFAAHWKWFPDGRTEWVMEESRPAQGRAGCPPPAETSTSPQRRGEDTAPYPLALDPRPSALD